MQCLHCGGCCKSMSPKSAPFRCPDLVRIEGYYFCRRYESSPELCRRFNFEEFRYCPYGMNELGLSDPDDLEIMQQRAADGDRIIADIQRRRQGRKNVNDAEE